MYVASDFWNGVRRKKPKQKQSRNRRKSAVRKREHPNDCFCELCREGDPPKKNLRTIRERLLRCFQSVKLIHRTATILDDGELIEKVRYLQSYDVPFVLVRDALKAVLDGSKLVFTTREDFRILESLASLPALPFIGCPNEHIHPDKAAEWDAWREYRKEQQLRAGIGSSVVAAGTGMANWAME